MTTRIAESQGGRGKGRECALCCACTQPIRYSTWKSSVMSCTARESLMREMTKIPPPASFPSRCTAKALPLVAGIFPAVCLPCLPVCSPLPGALREPLEGFLSALNEWGLACTGRLECLARLGDAALAGSPSTSSSGSDGCVAPMGMGLLRCRGRFAVTKATSILACRR